MKRRDIKNFIKTEGEKITPSVINDVYSKLGISVLSDSTDIAFENKLKEEQKIFIKDKKNDIYRALNIKPIENNNAQIVEYRIVDEKEDFVPNIKNKLAKELNIKKSNPLLAIFKKPEILAISSAVLVGVILTSVVLTNAFTSNTTDTTTNTNTTTSSTTITPQGRSTVNFKIQSASNVYNPEVIYTVEKTGEIDASSIVSVNDQSSNVLNSLSSSGSSIVEFTTDYLKSALNLGYLERKNVAKTNYIYLTVNSGLEDESYYKNVKESINDKIDEFIYENKVVAELVFVNQTSTNEDSELVQLIRQAYEISIRLFVDENGEPSKVLCFSTDFNDWLEKYKNVSEEYMEEYVELLLYIDNSISCDVDRARFVEKLEQISLIQDKIITLDSYYQTLYDVIEQINQKFGKYEPLDPDERPDDDYDEYCWDWWDDVGYNRGDRRDYKHEYENIDYDTLISELDKLDLNIENKSDYELRSLEITLREYTKKIKRLYKELKNSADDALDDLLDLLDNGEFDKGKPEYEDAHHEPPEDWDYEFDDWWDKHYH